MRVRVLPGVPKYYNLYIIMDFIKNNVTIDKVTGCWNWNKSVTSAGYGQFKRDGKYWTTHKFVATQKFGTIPDKVLVRYLCHNTRCCNPDHLALGSYKDNWKDSEELHRQSHYNAGKGYIIQGIYYRSMRIAKRATGISMGALSRHTDPDTRVFDIDAYRAGCITSKRWEAAL